MAKKPMSEMAAVTSPAGTEKMLVLDGTTPKVLTTTVMAGYAIDVLGDAAAATPTTGDDLVAFRGDDEKLLDLDATASYVVASAWSVAEAVTPILTGDLLLTNRAGVTGKATIDTVKTYVLTGIQATVTNLSTLSAATPVAANLILISQSGVGKQCAISALETLLWTDFYTYTKALSAATSIVGTDIFYCAQGAVPKSVTGSLLLEYISEQTSHWALVATSKYTATPASTSQISMSNTAEMAVGLPVRYVYGASTYYGIITAVSSNTSITIAGAPLNVGMDLTALHVGLPSQVVHQEYLIDTAFGDAAQDIFADVTYERHRWRRSNAYLVTFGATLGVVDTGASQPKINITIDGNPVSTTDTNKGIQLSGTEGTWVDNAAVAVDTSYYGIEWDDEIDIECTEAGTEGDADMLSVICVFVLE